jgi:hypothetical protein
VIEAAGADGGGVDVADVLGGTHHDDARGLRESAPFHQRQFDDALVFDRARSAVTAAGTSVDNVNRGDVDDAGRLGAHHGEKLFAWPIPVRRSMLQNSLPEIGLKGRQASP